MENKNYVDTMNKELLTYLEKAHEGDNIICSPYSLYILLALAMNAANGNSKAELLKALGFDSEEAANAFVKDMENEITSKGAVKVSSANGVIVKDSLYNHLEKPFLKIAKSIFAAEIIKGGSDMVAKINSFVAKKTHGMIEKILEDAPDNLSACLLNAVAFEAKWDTPYEESSIYEEFFTECNGEEKGVPMLHSDENGLVDTDCFEGFIKPYLGGEYEFMALLPKKEGKEALKEALKDISFSKLYEEALPCVIAASFPEFEVKLNEELSDFLQSIGIKDIFTGAADFSALTKNEPMYASSVVQNAFIKVNREGTKAAAATAMTMLRCSLLPEEKREIRIDRPFIYAIMNADTGLPVFTGVINTL